MYFVTVVVCIVVMLACMSCSVMVFVVCLVLLNVVCSLSLGVCLCSGCHGCCGFI